MVVADLIDLLRLVLSTVLLAFLGSCVVSILLNRARAAQVHTAARHKRQEAAGLALQPRAKQLQRRQDGNKLFNASTQVVAPASTIVRPHSGSKCAAGSVAWCCQGGVTMSVARGIPIPKNNQDRTLALMNFNGDPTQVRTVAHVLTHAQTTLRPCSRRRHSHSRAHCTRVQDGRTAALCVPAALV
jgi:hypothetical protein